MDDAVIVRGLERLCQLPRNRKNLVERQARLNPFRERLVFLAILSPAKADEPGVVDKSGEEPWKSLRGPEFPPCV